MLEKVTRLRFPRIKHTNMTTTTILVEKKLSYIVKE